MIKSIKKISRKHYIQCGLAVLLTGLVLYFTSAWWSSKAVIVSFNAEAKKEIQYQVFYTESGKQNFNEKQSVKKPIKSGSQKVEILLPIEKIVKIRLDIGSNPGEVVISDLQVKGLHGIKLNYDEFNKNQIDKFEVKNGKLYLTSNQGDPYLPYKSELNLPAGMQIDWCRLVIISVLAFLLMYKFVQYLSKFKIEKQHSRIDIVMLAVFFALLFVPMSHISDAEKSEQENRMLTKKPQLTIDGGGDNNYGVQFDAWYNDHFFGRDTFTDIVNYIKFNINKIYINGGVAFFKNNGFMITKRYIDEIPHYKKEWFKLISASLENFYDFCDSNSIKCYIEIVPRKLEFMKDKTYRIIPDEERDVANLFMGYLRDNKKSFKIIYPLEELKKANSKDSVFFKTDHHWTEWGAYNGYLAFMKQVKEDFPDVRIVSEDDYDIFYDKKIRAEYLRKFTIGRSCELLNLGEKHCQLDSDYKYYTHKEDKFRKIVNKGMANYDYTFSLARNPQKVFLVGNSFTENFLSFLSFTFSEVKKRRCNNAENSNLKLSRWKKEIMDYKPDILLILIETEYFNHLKDLTD